MDDKPIRASSQPEASSVKSLVAVKRGRKPTKPVGAKTLTNKPPRQNKNNQYTDKILKIREANPTLSERQTAELAGCSRSNVHLVLERYGVNNKTTEDFKTHRADIFAGLQDRILKSLTDEALKKTPAIQLITAAGILFDKERLERNQSTGNFSVIVGALQDLQRLRSGSDD